MERLLSYNQAVKEATEQEMERDKSVVIMGIGVDDPRGIYGTTLGLQETFGPDRVFDTPLAEDAMTGVAVGASLGGLRPMHIHIRMDFMLLAMNQLINQAAKMRYMYGGAVSVPIVVRVMVGRSWGQGPQHSQGLQSLFMHIPGLKVVAPTTAYDAKGCLVAALRDDNPVIYMEHRLLHGLKTYVPEELYSVEFGKARVLEEGSDLTVVGISHMILEVMRARNYLREVGISAEVIDPVSLSPLDIGAVLKSVKKTGRLLVVDNAWTMCGASSEIITQVVESMDGRTPTTMRRMGFQPVTCPTTKNLENEFYPNARTIAAECYSMVHGNGAKWIPDGDEAAEIVQFKGPF
ncbi:MAG: transketolase C-terminal domain-containing protein [Dehalococcoidia bacterium]|nr:transketolase C-terminal domain-containing protein [Dehalococcoidia bacterium]